MGSTTLTRGLLTDVSLMGVVTDTLGTGAGEYSDAEKGKGVTLAAAAYIAAVKADEIDGIVNTVESGLRNGGYSWGGIQKKGRAQATVGASQTGNVAVGALAINDTPIANATAGLIQVFTVGTGYVTPTTHMWRILQILTGTGAAGDSVIIERV